MDAGTQRLAERLMERYGSALKACNAVDFDDLILLVLELFNTDKEVLETCRKNHRYIMVDEYQDTNGKQFQLLKALASEHQNVCVVGDDDQSIYGWREPRLPICFTSRITFPEFESSSWNRITAQ